MKEDKKHKSNGEYLGNMRTINKNVIRKNELHEQI